MKRGKWKYILACLLLSTVLPINISAKPVSESQMLQKKKTEYSMTKYSEENVDVPDFDFSPINIGGKEGYLVKVNGKYGVVDLDGNFIMDSNYEKAWLTLFNADGSEQVCLFPDAEGVDGENLDYVLGSSTELACGMGIGTGAYNGYDTFDDTGVYHIGVSGERESIEYGDGIKLIHKTIDPSAEAYMDRLDMDHYYILSRNTGDVFGPYDVSEVATFDYFNPVYTPADSGSEYMPLLDWHASEIFYEQTNDGYTVWNTNGVDHKSGFDEVEIISFDAAKFTKDGYMGVIDSDMNVLLYGDFEDVSKPIGNKAYVKLNGKWKLITIQGAKTSKKNGYTLNYDMIVRKDAAKSSDKVMTLKKGKSVSIQETKNAEDGSTWGKIKDGQWICIQDNEMTYLKKES